MEIWKYIQNQHRQWTEWSRKKCTKFNALSICNRL